MKTDRELYDEALAIIDDNLQVVEGIIGNRFATASLIVEFAKKQVKNLAIHDVVNCVYVVTERDQYGEQLFKGVFANRGKAVEYLSEDGLKESNIDEINEIELN